MTTKVRTGMLEDNVATTAQLAALRSVFVGAIVDFPVLPGDPWWIPCFGQQLEISVFPALYLRLGTQYGGDGVTFFGLPDYRGRVRAGVDNMGGPSANRLTNQGGGLDGDVLGATGGSETHTLTEAQLASHGHAASSGSAGLHAHNAQGNISGSISGAGNFRAPRISGGTDAGATNLIDDAGLHNHPITVSPTGGGQAHNNVQPTIVQYACILAY